MSSGAATDLKMIPYSISAPGADAPCHCCCRCSCGGHLDAVAFADLPRDVRKRHRESVERLLPKLKGFLEALHKELLAGGLLGDDYARLDDLQRWVGDLLVEREMPEPKAKGR